MAKWQAWFNDQGAMRFFPFESDGAPTISDAARVIVLTLRDEGRQFLIPDRPRDQGEDHVLTLSGGDVKVLMPVQVDPPLPNCD
jgi:hypothetical protein